MEDVSKINTSDEIIVAVDKASMYRMSYENSDKHLSKDITQRYKKWKHQSAAIIAHECNSIARKLPIEDIKDNRNTCFHHY